MMRTSQLPATVLRRGLLAGAAVTATLVLSACAGSDHSSTGADHGAATTSSPAASAVGTFNDADVTFAQAMIPHHQQAVQMSAMTDGRAADAEVKELAGKIQAAQQTEIDTMTAWLAAWGRPAPAPHLSMGSGMGHGSMPGMMTDADMKKLMDAKDAAFDKHFLTMMISHHEGAVEMAQQELAQGFNPEAKALAQKIITDQQAEIATMKTILERL